MDSSANTAPRLSALLGRLASFGEDCDRRLAQIERRFQRINWEEPEEGSEDTADQMLEEAKGVTEGYKDLNKTLMESKSQLEGFLETSIEQIQEMSANIRQQEDWAASFGAYQPKIDIDTDFEEKIRTLEEQEREERAKQLAEKREELLKESGQIKEESEKEEDDEEPNIFDAKLSRATMEKLGYKFKESADSKDDSKKEPTAMSNDSEEEAESVRPTSETAAAATSSSLALTPDLPPPAAARDRCHFLDSGSSSGYDTPISILKTANSTLQQSMADASRIEITPGLVIRNPNHNRQKKTVPEPSPMKTPKRALERNLGSPSPALLPQRMLTPALGTPHSAMKRKLINPPSSLMRKGGPKKTLEPEQNDGGDDDECPETPQLRTVSIHKMREEQRRKEEAEQKKRDEEQKRKNLAQIMKTPVRLLDCIPHKVVTPSANWSVNQSVSTPESPEPRAALNVKKLSINNNCSKTGGRLLPPNSVTKPPIPRDDLTPETPELRTMNLKKLLMMKENNCKQSVSEKGDKIQEEPAEDVFDTPQMPRMSARKSHSILAASARKASGKKINFDEEDPLPQGEKNDDHSRLERNVAVEPNGGSNSCSSPGSPTPPRLRTMKL